MQQDITYVFSTALCLSFLMAIAKEYFQDEMTSIHLKSLKRSNQSPETFKKYQQLFSYKGRDKTWTWEKIKVLSEINGFFKR